MHGGSGSDGLAAHERDAVLALADRYDMAHHGLEPAPHARAIPTRSSTASRRSATSRASPIGCARSRRLASTGS
jgi:hypothetical protein